ncbi:MAG: hypothetical protein HRU20_14910 [Pseudomonadales bacterium]|nr:hypothetical protein [Pseudomonadales bacterium]
MQYVLALIVVLSLASCGEDSSTEIDSDGDGILDSQDAFPNDWLETIDSDGDGIGDNRDPDDDNDDIYDIYDAFPYDASEHADADNDGIGDNADPDDDNDNVEDSLDPFPYDSNISFKIKTLADKVKFDVQRRHVYTLNKSTKTFQIHNLDNYSKIAEWSFEFTPVDFKLSPSSNEIFIALSSLQVNSDVYPNVPIPGKVVVIDTLNLSFKSEIDLEVDVESIEITNDKYLIVDARLDKAIHSYDVASGMKVSEAEHNYNYNYNDNLLLLPDGKTLITHLEGSNGFSRYDVTDGLLTFRYEHKYGPNYVGYGIIASPKGNYIVTLSGNAYTISDDIEKDLLYLNHFYRGKLSGIESLAFDEKRNITFTLEAVSGYPDYGVLRYSNSQSFESIAAHKLGAVFQNFTIDGNELVIASQKNEYLYFGRIAHPCLECGNNTPPVAKFKIDTNTASAGTYIFDATISSDVDNSIEELLVRWDWNSDGEFDTEFSNILRQEKQFEYAGTKAVTMQIKDPAGNTSLYNNELHIQGDFKSEEDGSAFIELQFDVTDLLKDPQRSQLYISNSKQKKLYFLDTLTGLVTNSITFEYEPHRMMLSHDGKSLYVALNAFNNMSYKREGIIQSFVAEIDVDNQSVKRLILLPFNPYDMAFLDDGHLILSGHSHISIYDLESELEVASSDGWARKNLLFKSPLDSFIFASTMDLTTTLIKSYTTIDAEIKKEWEFRDTYDYQYLYKKIYLLENGKFISAGGDVFLPKEGQFIFESNIFNLQHRINDIYNDALQKKMIIASVNMDEESDRYRKLHIKAYDETTLEELSTIELPWFSDQKLVYMHIYSEGNQVFIIDKTYESNLIRKYTLVE